MKGQIDIRLANPISEKEMEKISLFRLRFGELWENWESLKQLGITIGGSFENKGDGEISGSGCGIDRHRLKGFYMDFRFFFADREPTQYFKIANLIKKLSDDAKLNKCLDIDKENWREAGLLKEWHGYSADDLTKILFNGSLFHSGNDLRQKLGELKTVMDSELANHLLVFSIFDRMLVVRNLSWVTEPLSINNQYIRVPKWCA